MLIYNYITNNKETKQISIELFNTDFVNYWVQYLDRISGKCPRVDWYIAGLNNCKWKRNPVDNVFDLLKIRDSFNFINRNGLENLADEITVLERLMAFPDKVNQQHLNKWHRIFTNLEMTYLKLQKKYPEHLDRKEIWQNIQDINMYVHHMESWTYHHVERRIPYLKHMQYSIQFTNANNLSYTKPENQVFSEKNIEWIENFEFDFSNENYNATVWLHEDITGKDQIKAWLDEDNLNEFDITGNLLMTPSITLDPNMLYKQILDLPEFRKDSIKSNKKLNRFPLGNIIKKDNIDWDEFFISKIQNVNLFGKTIWPKEFL